MTSNKNKGQPITCICKRRDYHRNYSRARYAGKGREYHAQRFQDKKEQIIAQRRRLQRSGEWKPREPTTTERVVEQIRRRNKQYREASPEKFADYVRKSTYGLPLGEYARMAGEQKNLCFLCGRPMRRPHLDHCHATGRIRKLLCGGCNLAIGIIERDPAWLARALEYLKPDIETLKL